MGNLYYLALVHKDEDSAFGIEFPDVEGVFSAADEESDIVSNAIEALRLFAEDQPLPEPRGLAPLHADPAVRQALAAGAFLVRIPLIENDGRTERINISLQSGMIRAIDAAAKDKGMSRSSFIAEAARSAIEK